MGAWMVWETKPLIVNLEAACSFVCYYCACNLLIRCPSRIFFPGRACPMHLQDLEIVGGKARTVCAKDGHLGIILVKFAGDQSGLKKAVRLAEFFEREKHGRRNWTLLQSLTSGKDEENNPNLVKVDEKTGEKMKILYGFLGTAADPDKVDFEMRKKAAIECRKDYESSHCSPGT